MAKALITLTDLGSPFYSLDCASMKFKYLPNPRNVILMQECDRELKLFYQGEL